MTIGIKKIEALKFFCLARQAERSIDFALSCQRQWDLLRQYYEAGRLNRLESAVKSLQALIPGAARPYATADTAFRISAWWILTYPARLIFNRFRVSWRFQEAEAQFIVRTFESAVALLRQRQKPDAQLLVLMRMDLHACEVIIERKLAGVPETHQAQRIEHFCQAPHIKPFLLEELAGREVKEASRLSA